MAKTTDSSLWKDVTNIMPKIMDNGMWIVGDGKTIRAWEDNWLGAEFSLKNYNVTIPDKLWDAYMRDLIDNMGNQNLPILNSWLSEQWIDRLKACVPPKMMDFSDNFCFTGISNNDFSVKEMYNMLEDFVGTTVDGEWRKIQKYAVLERCKLFMWMLKHDCLLTNY